MIFFSKTKHNDCLYLSQMMAEEEEVSEARILVKSAYEINRDLRVQRNKQILADLFGNGTTTTPNNNNNNNNNDQDDNDNKEKTAIKPRKRKKVAEEDVLLPKRKSPRFQPNAIVENASTIPPLAEQEEQEEEAINEVDDEEMKLRIEKLQALHTARGTEIKNPTATYQHTWMRVKTMSDKALETRIRVIEKAQGQHALVKMQMFTEVLLLAGKEQLSNLALAALQRLLKLNKNFIV